MHEPLPRNWTIKDAPNATLALVRACAFAVILSVALVGAALIAAEFIIAGPHQAATMTRLTTGNVASARDAAPSSNDLFSGMPLP